MNDALNIAESNLHTKFVKRVQLCSFPHHGILVWFSLLCVTNLMGVLVVLMLFLN